ncbi:hypothetical protein LCGC14_2993620, partial [marine sediment metagenome]
MSEMVRIGTHRVRISNQFAIFYKKRFLMDEYVKQKKVNASIQLENLENRDFSVIPEKEKKQTWFLLLAPIIAARRLRNEPQNSPLSHVLNQSTGPSIHTWKGVKRLIKFVLKMVDNAESIFSRTAEIKTDSNPDGIIRDMFAELRTVLYLDYKGFKNIRYIHLMTDHFYSKKFIEIIHSNFDFKKHLFIIIRQRNKEQFISTD